MPNGFVTPYVGGVYDSPNLVRIADMLRQAGADQAAAIQHHGDLAAQMWGTLGTGAEQLIRAPQVVRDQQLARQAATTRLALENEQLTAAKTSNTETQKKLAEKDQLGALLTGNLKDGLYDIDTITKSLPASMGADGPALIDALNKANELQQTTRAADINRPIATMSKAIRNVYDISAADGSDVLDNLGAHLALGVSNKQYKPETAANYYQTISAAKDKKRALLGLMAPEDRPKTEYKEQAPGASTVEVTPGLPPTVVSSSPPLVKAGSEEDWVARDRRLAVAKNGGRPLTDEQQRAVDTASLQQFKETNADPELRAAALAQKSMALVLQQMQQAQMPTPAQAHDVAADLVAHRLAPEQMSQMFGGFGMQGQAFKRMVYGEAKKIDPQFDFEQAAAEYGLVKSPAFQTTVRVMDSTLESIPRLMKNATALANGKFRTWNAIVNAGKNEFNDTDLKRLKTDAVLVGDEVAKILQGGGTGSATSDAKLRQGVDLLGQTDSVPAMAAAVNEINALIGTRRKALTRGTYLENAQPAATATAAPKEGTEGTVNGTPAVWKTVNGKTGWYAK